MDRKERKKLDSLYKRLTVFRKTCLGYPGNGKFDYSPLYKFLGFNINNIGDPFDESSYPLQTKEFEREVLKFFARLFHIRDYWGHITNGGTEGNLYGLYAARETLPGADVFFSEHTHYSIGKNIHILGMKARMIRTLDNGEMDYDDLEEKVKRKKSVIVVANIGTTITGAIDNVQKISRILEKHKIKYYIHADAAFYGPILPFCSRVKFDFRTKIDSISISGHKFIGAPTPCGIVLARKTLTETLQDYIEYIDSHDTTLSGSRDGFAALILWYRIKTLGLKGFRKQVQYSNRLADFLVSGLKKIGWPDVGQSYVTVWFRRPSEKIIKKWHLAVHKENAHVICLPHETRGQLKNFVQDLKEEMGSLPHH